MPSIGRITTRTTSLMVSDSLLSVLRRTQQDMLKAQNEISTGKSVARPSDAPAKASSILSLQRQLEARAQQDRNLQHASAVLDGADSALRDATDLLIEARDIASSQVGVGSNADTRANQASVVDAQIQALIDLGNRKFQNVPFFGGQRAPNDGGAIFTQEFGGVRYRGTRENLGGDAGLDAPLDFNSNGADAFNVLSSRVMSEVDVNAGATAGTRLAEINGAAGRGFQGGSVVVTIDGTAVTVDLDDAETLGDVTTRINDAITGVDPAAGSLAFGAGFALTAAAGHTITIGESGAGVTAADLGIGITATAATTAGGDIDSRITTATTLASLGAAINWAGGLRITQGDTTKVADFTGATTVQDVMNVVDQLDLGVRLEINEAGSGFNLVSEVSGAALSIGENGGTTATDLGLRTLGTDTELADFRNGLGVATAAGDDFEVQLRGGASFRVDLGGATTVGEVITAIQAAATTAGLNVGAPGAAGTDFNVGLASIGNGLVLEDGTAGGGSFRVLQVGESLAADNLGIYQNAGTAGTIAGADTATVRVDSAFSHLIALRDALRSDSASGITLAGGGIERDIDQVTRARADVGVRAKRVEQQQSRSAELKLAEQTLLGGLQDAEPAEVITRFTQLQQQLEASLRVGAQSMQLSLWDFLR